MLYTIRKLSKKIRLEIYYEYRRFLNLTRDIKRQKTRKLDKTAGVKNANFEDQYLELGSEIDYTRNISQILFF